MVRDRFDPSVSYFSQKGIKMIPLLRVALID